MSGDKRQSDTLSFSQSFNDSVWHGEKLLPSTLHICFQGALVIQLQYALASKYQMLWGYQSRGALRSCVYINTGGQLLGHTAERETEGQCWIMINLSCRAWQSYLFFLHAASGVCERVCVCVCVFERPGDSNLLHHKFEQTDKAV